MNITIIGAGAMGSLFGGLLAEAGHEVWLMDIWADHVNTLNQKGLAIEFQGDTRTIPVQAALDAADVPRSDLVIIFVKSTQTRNAAATAKKVLSETGMVLTLQNGMGNADAIAKEVDPVRVIAGTTSHGATLLGPGHIRHAGKGPTMIGLWEKGDRAAADPVVTAFESAGIQTEYNPDIRQVIWEKLLVNVGINAITALTNIRNGQILDLPVTRKLSEDAVREAMAVARASGVTVREDAVDHVLSIARATAANRSSMGQDVDNHRLTEISAINGAVVATARKLDLPVPVNQTLTALVETLQAHYEN